MKKIALVLAVLLVIGGTAFAEVTVGGEATVAGSVTTTIGMDLESQVWGADADSSITLTIPLAAGSDGASGDDDLYGEITLSGVAVNISGTALDDDNNSDGDIAAKIVAGDLYVGLNSADMAVNKAAGTGDFDVNLDDDWFGAPAYGNLELGFDNGMIGFAVELAPKSGIVRAAGATANEDFVGPWDGETAEADATDTTQGTSGIVLGVDVSYTSEMISVPVQVVYDPAYTTGNMLLGVSAVPSVTAGPVTLTVPVDFVSYMTSGFDLAPTLSFAVMDGLTIAADGYYYSHEADSLLNAGVCITADGLVPALTASVDVDLSDLMGTLGWGVDVALAYAAADGLTVSVDPGYDSTSDFDLAVGVEMGAAFTGIDNTCISLNWGSATFGTNADMGVVSLATKVSF